MPEPPNTGDAVQAAWLQMRTAFLANDARGFADATTALDQALAALPAAYRPAPDKIALELTYNRVRPYNRAWKLMLAGVVLAAAALILRRRWADVLAVVVMLLGFAQLTYGLWMRWSIAGRIPAANMFESLLFLSWGAGAFAILAMLVTRYRPVPLTASIIGALALFLADVLPLDHFIRPIAPVLLDTVWMSIHVPGIMVSYAVLALAALVAHVQVAAMALVPRRREVIQSIDALHYWAMHVGVILLGAGIITGSMWAASSWGRYWGWDPKEVWSLIAFLAYLVIMHVRVDRENSPRWLLLAGAGLAAVLLAIIIPLLMPLGGMSIGAWLKSNGVELGALAAAIAIGAMFILLHGQFAVAFKSAVAFWFIIMTYIGVNYVLGIGLHSYGFGTGAVVHYMMLTGSIDLGIIALLAVIYLLRTRGGTAEPA